MNKRGQITVELILISVVALILLLYIFDIFDNRVKDINNKKLEFKAKEVNDKIANGINSAFLNGDGAKVNIKIPNKLNNKDYSVIIFPNAHIVEIKWLDFSYTTPIISSNINNTNIQNKEFNLTNVNGKIFIQQ